MQCWRLLVVLHLLNSIFVSEQKITIRVEDKPIGIKTGMFCLALAMLKSLTQGLDQYPH